MIHLRLLTMFSSIPPVEATCVWQRWPFAPAPHNEWILLLDCCAVAEPRHAEPHSLRLGFHTPYGEMLGSIFGPLTSLGLNSCTYYVPYNTNPIGSSALWLRDYSDYVILLFSKYSWANLKPFHRGLLLLPCNAKLLGTQDVNWAAPAVTLMYGQIKRR